MSNWTELCLSSVYDYPVFRDLHVDRIHTYWLSILVATNEESRRRGGVRRGLFVIAERLGLFRPEHRPRAGSMSRSWLCEYDLESSKHDVD
jgi:hypothetical protein